MFRRIARNTALGSLGFFVSCLAASWTGLIPEVVALPLIAVALIAFFISVGVYFVAYARDFGRDESDVEHAAVSETTDAATRYWVLEGKSILAARRTQAAELFIIAALMSIFVLGLLGSFVSNALAVAGTAFGVTLAVIAIGFYLFSMVRAFRTREALWLEMGRRRWQFAAYIVATILLMVAAVGARVLYDSKAVSGVGIIIGLGLLYRIRLLMQDLW